MALKKVQVCDECGDEQDITNKTPDFEGHVGIDGAMALTFLFCKSCGEKKFEKQLALQRKA